jgi:hypothetical protein
MAGRMSAYTGEHCRLLPGKRCKYVTQRIAEAPPAFVRRTWEARGGKDSELSAGDPASGSQALAGADARGLINKFTP